MKNITPSNGSKHKFLVLEADFMQHEQFVKLNLVSKNIYSFLLYRLNISPELGHVNTNGIPYVRQTQKQFAAFFGVGVATVERAIKELKQFGLIEVVQKKVANAAEIYVYEWQDVAKLRADADASAHQNDGRSAHQNDGRSAHQNDGPIYNKSLDNQELNNSDTDVSKDTSDITNAASGASGVLRCSPRMNGLLQKPKKTKTEQKWDKWCKERITELNGRGYTREVEVALNSFLMMLRETNKAANQLTSISWNYQLDKLDELSVYPDLQKQAVYDAITTGSKNLAWAVEKWQKKENLIQFRGPAFNPQANMEPKDLGPEVVGDDTTWF